MLGWLTSWWSSCLLAGTVVFTPTPDISTYELAVICQHGACTKIPIGDPEKIPDNLKRQFKPYDCKRN